MNKTKAELQSDLFLTRIALSIFAEANDVIFYNGTNSTVVDEIMGTLGLEFGTDPGEDGDGGLPAQEVLEIHEQVLVELISKSI